MAVNPSDQSIYPLWRTGKGPWKSTIASKMFIDPAVGKDRIGRCLIEMVDGKVKITPITDEEHYKDD